MRSYLKCYLEIFPAKHFLNIPHFLIIPQIFSPKAGNEPADLFSLPHRLCFCGEVVLLSSVLKSYSFMHLILVTVKLHSGCFIDWFLKVISVCWGSN